MHALVYHARRRKGRDTNRNIVAGKDRATKRCFGLPSRRPVAQTQMDPLVKVKAEAIDKTSINFVIRRDLNLNDLENLC